MVGSRWTWPVLAAGLVMGCTAQRVADGDNGCVGKCDGEPAQTDVAAPPPAETLPKLILEERGSFTIVGKYFELKPELIPSNATGLSFELRSSTGNAELILWKDVNMTEIVAGSHELGDEPDLAELKLERRADGSIASLPYIELAVGRRTTAPGTPLTHTYALYVRATGPSPELDGTVIKRERGVLNGDWDLELDPSTFPAGTETVAVAVSLTWDGGNLSVCMDHCFEELDGEDCASSCEGDEECFDVCRDETCNDACATPGDIYLDGFSDSDGRGPRDCGEVYVTPDEPGSCELPVSERMSFWMARYDGFGAPGYEVVVTALTSVSSE